MDNKTPTNTCDFYSASPTPTINGYSTPKKQIIIQYVPNAPIKVSHGSKLTNNSILLRRGLKQLPSLNM